MFKACGAVRGVTGLGPLVPLDLLAHPRSQVKGHKWVLRLNFTSGHGQEQELELNLLDNALLRVSKT